MKIWRFSDPQSRRILHIPIPLKTNDVEGTAQFQHHFCDPLHSRSPKLAHELNQRFPPLPHELRGRSLRNRCARAFAEIWNDRMDAREERENTLQRLRRLDPLFLVDVMEFVHDKSPHPDAATGAAHAEKDEWFNACNEMIRNNITFRI